MTIGTEVSIGFYPKSETPDLDERKYNNGVPYDSTDEVLASIPLISRAHYLEVNISGHWYYFEADLTTLTPKGTGTTAAFTDLTDCPSTYAGDALSIPTVNVSENGLEFTETKEAEFTDLSDVPQLYTGSGGLLVSVKADETGLEFIPLSVFPGFGTTHSLAAYGDHNHSGIYQPVGSYELSTNKITSLNSGSTDAQYPSAKVVYNNLQSVISLMPIAGSFSQTVTAVTTFVVTIGQTMANTTYKVCVTPTDMLAAAVFYVTSKSTTQFTVTYLTAITGAVTFDWIIVP